MEWWGIYVQYDYQLPSITINYPYLLHGAENFQDIYQSFTDVYGDDAAALLKAPWISQQRWRNDICGPLELMTSGNAPEGDLFLGYRIEQYCIDQIYNLNKLRYGKYWQIKCVPKCELLLFFAIEFEHADIAN